MEEQAIGDAQRLERLREDARKLPENFEKDNADFFEPEYMRVLSPRERQKALQELFTHKTMEWLESSEDAPDLEEALRQNEFMKEAARWMSISYVELGIITEEQRTEKLRMIGVSDPQ